MNPTNATIEASLFGTLKIHCPSIKNLCSFNSKITLKEILTTQPYLDEKLNLFIWVILKYEPRFSNEFVEHQFLSAETKCKKILESLHMIQLIDMNEFGSDKFVSSSERSFREQLHILNDLVRLLNLQSSEQFIPIRNKSPNYEENLAFEFNNLTMTQECENQFVQPQVDEAALMRKIQILDDPTFLSEFRGLLQFATSSLISPDINKLIKMINEHSEHMKELPITKSTRRDEMLSFVESKLSALDVNRQASNPTAEANENAMRNLEILGPKSAESTRSLEFELNNFKADLKQVNAKMKSRVPGLAESSGSSSSRAPFSNCTNQLVESGLGRCFQDFSEKKESLDKLSQCFSDWSLFIDNQMAKQNEYAKSELIVKDARKQAFSWGDDPSSDLSHQVEKYLSWLGEEARRDANMTSVDDMLS